MTDNQFNQLFELITKSVNGIQRLEKDVVEIKSDIVEIKSDISELKQGQARIEKQMSFTNRSLNIQQGDILNIRTRVEALENEKELSS